MDSKLSGQARQLPRGEVSAATRRVVSCMHRDCALPVTSMCCLHLLLNEGVQENALPVVSNSSSMRF